MARLNSLDNVDKLLEIASQPKEKKSKGPKANPDVDNFILECNITSGKKRIPTYIIYHRYVLWKKVRLVPRNKFISYFKTKFEKTKTSDGVGFLLSPKGFDMTPGGFFRARAHLRKEKDEKQKSKTKT